MKLSQNEVYEFFKKTMSSHEVKSEGNKIIGKRLINSPSFQSFKVTFLKNGMYSLKGNKGKTLRYDDIMRIFSELMGMSSFGDHYEYFNIKVQEE